MNKLLQFEDGILASADDVEILKNKENAKILVISDSHGNINYVKEIITKLGSGCDCLIFTGDGIFDFLGALESIHKDKKSKNPPYYDPIISKNKDFLNVGKKIYSSEYYAEGNIWLFTDFFGLRERTGI